MLAERTLESGSCLASFFIMNFLSIQIYILEDKLSLFLNMGIKIRKKKY